VSFFISTLTPISWDTQYKVCYTVHTLQAVLLVQRNKVHCAVYNIMANNNQPATNIIKVLFFAIISCHPTCHQTNRVKHTIRISHVREWPDHDHHNFHGMTSSSRWYKNGPNEPIKRA
jgi:hypothetical protein